MKRIVLIIHLLLWIHFLSVAQCDKSLVRKATENAGKETVLVRDFKVKLKEGSKRNPIPSAKFNVIMQKGVSYRFDLANAADNPGKAILQLFDKSNLLGSSVQENGNASDLFRYTCSYTGEYQVVFTFSTSKAGCAAGVMSMIVDSAFLASYKQKDEDTLDVLYLNMENPLTISTDSVTSDRLLVSTDNGAVVKKEDQYFAYAERLGKATIKVKRVGADEKVIEEMSKKFEVRVLDEPKIFLEGMKDNYINREFLTTTSKLEVIPTVYRIVEFYISDSRIPYSGLHSPDQNLTYEQREYLRNMQFNDHFYINNIKLERPDGSYQVIGCMEFYVK